MTHKEHRYCHYCNKFTVDKYTVEEFINMNSLCEECRENGLEIVYDDRKDLYNYINGYPGEKSLDVLIDLFLYFANNSDSCVNCANLNPDNYCLVNNKQTHTDNWCFNFEMAKKYPMIV